MFRLFVFTISLTAATAAWGQTYDPKVAYTKVSGSSQELYLANADGTRAVRVATVGRDPYGFPGNIHGLDFAPGGGRIAYTDATGLTVLTYTASSSGIKVDRRDLLVPGRDVYKPDFSPDGTRIIFHTPSNSTTPNSVRVVTVPGGVEVLSYPCSHCSEPRWLRSELGDAFSFRRWNHSGPSPIPEIWTALVEQDGTVTAGLVLSAANQAFGGIEDFDVAHTRDALLVTVNNPTGLQFIEFDLGSDNFGAITDKGGPGRRGHYFADDSRILFISPHLASGDFVSSLDPATGLITRLTKKGSYGTADARP